MGFWEALFGAGLALGVLLLALSRYVPTRPVGVALIVGGIAVFGARAVQAGPYVYPSGFDLFVGSAGIVLGSVLLPRRRQDRRWPSQRAARVLLALSPLALLGTAIATIHEIGEIVTLRTTDSQGNVRETRLAVLDYDGATWVGAGSGEERHWYQELHANPRVELVRAGASSCRVAKASQEPAVRHEVCRRLEEKYLSARVAGALGSHLFLNPKAIAIRLDPCPE